MGAIMAETAAIIWADGPPNEPYSPEKSRIRAWGTWLEYFITGIGGTAGSVFATRAALYGDLAHTANSMAWVISDPTVAYNGIYQKSGATGSGSWARVGDLPYSFVTLSDTGAGTPNAIQLTSVIPTSPAALRVANVFEANAGNVTVSENGGVAKPLLTSSGNQISPGGLLANMMIAYVDSGASYRLLSDQASAAIQAAAEAAKSGAEAARDAAIAAVPNVFPLTRTALKAVNTAVNTSAYLLESGREGQFLWRSGDFSAQISADSTEAIYVKANAVAATAGAWVRIYDGLNINTSWCGGNWQAAIDLASFLSVPTVTPSGTYTATSATGALKMRPGITLHNFSGNATLTMANGAQLLGLLEFNTYSAAGARVIGVTIDGNRANNADDLLSKYTVQVGDQNDVTIQRCKIINSNGNGIYVRNAFRTIIDNNKFSNLFVAAVIVSATVKSNYRLQITNNTIDGEWGQHAIIVKYSNFARVQGNYIVGQCVRGFSINVTSGNSVNSLSGNYFLPSSVGKFIIFNGGVEGLITGYYSPTLVTVNLNIGNPGTVPAAWGNGDVISIQGSDDCDISENLVYGGASLGISVFSDGTNSANRNKIYKNRVVNQGSAGISIQNISPTLVLATLIEGNNVVDCGLNGSASALAYNVGIAVRGAGSTQRVSVIGNIIEGYAGTPTMDYGIAFDAAVASKLNSGNQINGTIGGKTIQNP